MYLPKVSIDMDGIVADFFYSALQAHGATDRASIWPKGVWNMDQVIGVTIDEFWKKIDETEGFWEGLAVLADGKDIVQSVVQSGLPWAFLTSPSESPQCRSGKRIWVMKHFPQAKMIQCEVSKAICAAPGRLLVDDSDENVRGWREAGGDAVLVSRPWNNGTDDFEQVIQDIGGWLEGASASNLDTTLKSPDNAD